MATIFVGTTDGGGGTAGSAPLDIYPGYEPTVHCITLRDGIEASTVHHDGKLKDRFTRPSQIHQTNTVLFSGAGGYSHLQHSGLIVIDRALTDIERQRAMQWLGARAGAVFDGVFPAGLVAERAVSIDLGSGPIDFSPTA